MKFQDDSQNSRWHLHLFKSTTRMSTHSVRFGQNNFNFATLEGWFWQRFSEVFDKHINLSVNGDTSSLCVSYWYRWWSVVFWHLSWPEYLLHCWANNSDALDAMADCSSDASLLQRHHLRFMGDCQNHFFFFFSPSFPFHNSDLPPAFEYHFAYGESHQVRLMTRKTYRFVMLLLISATSMSISSEDEVEDGGLTISVDTRPVGTL